MVFLLNLHLPGQANVPLRVSVSSGTYTGPVAITVTGLPSGITVSPSPLLVNAGSAGNLMLTAAQNAAQEKFGFGSLNATSTVNIIGAVGSTTSSSPLSLTVSLGNAGFAPAMSAVNLPVVNINTGGQGITSKTVDVAGTITITSADGKTSYLPNSSDSDSTATFHVHGETTAAFPKLPYNVKLNTSLDLLAQMGLSCPYTTGKKATCDKSKSFLLLANYDDKSLLRDWAASALANAIPFGGSYLDETALPAGSKGTVPTPSGTSAHLPWASRSLFVELYIDGQYEGNYQLIEQIKVDSHRVNITELTETDTTDDVTGGYLLEIDQHANEAYVFSTPQLPDVGVIDPDFSPDPQVPQQMAYISSYVNKAEGALFSANFTDPAQGWRAYFDEASAINFYLVNDIMGNVDGGTFYSSDYLYKAIDNPFLYMGPIWDFDISSGNTFQPIEYPAAVWMATQAPWYVQWLKDPGFKADLTTQFNALKNNGIFSQWITSIQSQAATLEQSQANNFARWPMLGMYVYPNAEAMGNYDDEVTWLTDYLSLRVGYMDSLYNAKTATTTTLAPTPASIAPGQTVTLSATVSGGVSPTGLVYFIADNVVIGKASIDATGTATVNTAKALVSSLYWGNSTVWAVYAGDTQNALSTSPSSTMTINNPRIPSVTALASSSSSTLYGGAITLNVAVLGNSGNTTPTGTVNFLVSGAVVSSAALDGNGNATSTLNSLPAGADMVTAQYAGDGTFAPSTSAATLITVIKPDFTVASSTTTLSVSRGQPAQAMITLTPTGGFNSPVTLSCTLPLPYSTCLFSPSTVTWNGSAYPSSTMTVTVDVAVSALARPRGPARVTFRDTRFLLALLAFPLLGLRHHKRKLRKTSGISLGLCLVALAFGGSGLLGCSQSNSALPTTPAGTYTVVVNAVGGGITKSSQISVSVQ